jgi:hypothetical protein
VPTYDLRPATYTSDYVRFTVKEIRDHNDQVLDKLDREEEEIINKFNPLGRWPFVFINGQYSQVGSGYSPGLVDGTDFDTLRQQLTSGLQNETTDAITKEANLITKYLCRSTGGQPAAACQQL